jgi:hypothetical protein
MLNKRETNHSFVYIIKHNSYYVLYGVCQKCAAWQNIINA